MRALIARYNTPASKRNLFCIGLALLLAWLTFFDSHSLLDRYKLSREYDRLAAENAQLEADLETVQTDLKAVESDAVVEKVAREQYGMRKEGETVYRVDAGPTVDD